MRYAWVGEQLYAADDCTLYKYAGDIRDGVEIKMEHLYRIGNPLYEIVRMKSYEQYLIILSRIQDATVALRSVFHIQVFCNDKILWYMGCPSMDIRCVTQGIYVGMGVVRDYQTGNQTHYLPSRPWAALAAYGDYDMHAEGGEMHIVNAYARAVVRRVPYDHNYRFAAVDLVGKVIIIYTGFGHAYREKGILYANDAAVSPKGRYFVDWDSRGHFSVQSLITPHLDCIRPLLAQRLGADVARLVTHLL